MTFDSVTTPPAPPNSLNPASSSPPEIAGLSNAVTMLRDQVDALQIQAAERKKPWYQNASLMLSMLALLVSATFSSLSVYFRMDEQATSAQQSHVGLVRQNISALADLQTQWFEASLRAGTNAAAQAQTNSNYNAKRQMLIEETKALIDKDATGVTSAMLLTFGYQIAAGGEGSEGRRYFDRALQTAKSELAKAAALRAIGQAELQAGSALNVADGRRHWSDAIVSLTKLDDQASHFLRADNYRIWALQEFALGNRKLADSLIEQARAATRLMLPSPVRTQTEMLLAAPFPTAGANPIGAASSAPAASAVDWSSASGEWTIRFADGAEGRITLAPNWASGLWALQGYVARGGRIIETRTGSAYPSDGSALLIEWRGVRQPVPGAAPTPVFGNLRLQRQPDGTYAGSDDRMGERPARVVLARPR